MKNKQLLLVFAFSTFIASVAVAQEVNQKPVASQSQTLANGQDTKKYLKLTPEQELKYDEIVKEYQLSSRDIQKRRYDLKNKEAKMELNHEQLLTKMQALLQPEQYQTYLKLNTKPKSEKVDMRKKPVLGSVNAK